MTKRFCAAAVFVFLTVTAPARASTTAIDAVNVTFANGYTLTGEMGFFYDVFIPGYSFPVPGPTGLYLNGQGYFASCGAPDGSDLCGLFWNPPPVPPSGSPLFAVIGINLADVPNNLTFADFALLSSKLGPPLYAGVSGTVSCVSRCDINAVPLPAALPLFGSALLGLAGFAAYRSRRTRRA
jgi:hypothetical protein